MTVYWYQVYQARLRECLLTSRGLLSDSTCILEVQLGKLDIKTQTWYSIYQFTSFFTLKLVIMTSLLSFLLITWVLEAEPGKLDIKRSEPGILFISLQVDSLFKLAIVTSLSSFMLIQCHWWCHSKSAKSWWPDKGTCRQISCTGRYTVGQLFLNKPYKDLGIYFILSNVVCVGGTFVKSRISQFHLVYTSWWYF